MFYSPELLTLRNNGKFAKCWLAAHLSRRVFCARFRRQTITAIRVGETCKELIEYIINQSSDRRHRMSLYLSAQLMTGAARIFCYQADMILKHALELWHSSEGPRKLRDGGEDGDQERGGIPIDLMQLPILEPPPFAHTMENVVKNAARVTLTEENIFQGFEQMMHDADDSHFGALSPTQVAHILQHDGLPFASPESIRALPDESTMEGEDIPHIFEAPAPVPLPPAGPVRHETTNIGQIPEGSAEALPYLNDVEPVVPTEKVPTIQEIPGTPKRGLPSPPAIETPRTKKRRLEMTSVDPPLLPQTPSIEEQQPPAPPPPSSFEEASTDFSLESLDGYPLVPTKKKKPRKLITDGRVSLPKTDKRDDVLFMTIPKAPPSKPKPSVAQLFTNRSTRPNCLVANHLNLILQERILEPIILPPVEDHAIQNVCRIPPAAPTPGGPLRAPDSSAADTFGDLSNKDRFVKTITSDDVSKDENTKTLEQALMDTGPILPPPIDEGPGDDGVGETLPELPEEGGPELPSDISHHPKNVRNVFREWVESEELRSPRFSSVHPDLEKSITPISIESGAKKLSSGSFTSRAEPALVRADVLGQLEVAWSQRRLVDFRHFCPPSDHNKKEAARTLALLLAMHKSKDVKLMQAKPYAPIYIQKYHNY